MRTEADDWHQRRTDYMMERLEAGRHPDTDPAFWKEFAPGTPPEPWDYPPPATPPDELVMPYLTWGGLGLAACSLGILALLGLRRRRDRPVARR